jgi:hypothetical protein
VFLQPPVDVDAEDHAAGAALPRHVVGHRRQTDGTELLHDPGDRLVDRAEVALGVDRLVGGRSRVAGERACGVGHDCLTRVDATTWGRGGAPVIGLTTIDRTTPSPVR